MISKGFWHCWHVLRFAACTLSNELWLLTCSLPQKRIISKAKGCVRDDKINGFQDIDVLFLNYGMMLLLMIGWYYLDLVWMMGRILPEDDEIHNKILVWFLPIHFKISNYHYRGAQCAAIQHRVKKVWVRPGCICHNSCITLLSSSLTKLYNGSRNPY